ncbi:MAG TPA: ABC transporter permease [Solimonas sp.]|nr:ABC transporter permease [Solimonas sp.]
MSLGKTAAWAIVCAKEIRETVRDRRVLMSALVYGPLLGPAMIGGMLWFLANKTIEDRAKVLELPVVGAQYAPSLVGFLRQQGVRIVDGPDDPERAIRQQHNDAILRIPADYGAHWNAGEPARVELLYDSSRQFAQVSVGRAREQLQLYSSRIAQLRLQIRGVNPQVASPVAVDEQDLSTAESRAAFVLAFLPFLLIVAAFTGSMNIAIDTTTGERERQSLEPLLINPVPRGELMAGKLVATTLFALAGLAISVLGFTLVVRLVPQIDQFDLVIAPRTALLIFLVTVPVALLAAASQTIIASGAKTFKEAQGYLQLFMLLPMLPSMFQMLSPLRPEAWMHAMPLLSQSLLITQLSRGEPPSPAAFALSVGGTFALSLLLCSVCVWLYRRENLALSG